MGARTPAGWPDHPGGVCVRERELRYRRRPHAPRPGLKRTAGRTRPVRQRDLHVASLRSDDRERGPAGAAAGPSSAAARARLAATAATPGRRLHAPSRSAAVSTAGTANVAARLRHGLDRGPPRPRDVRRGHAPEPQTPPLHQAACAEGQLQPPRRRDGHVHRAAGDCRPTRARSLRDRHTQAPQTAPMRAPAVPARRRYAPVGVRDDHDRQVHALDGEATLPSAPERHPRCRQAQTVRSERRRSGKFTIERNAREDPAGAVSVTIVNHR